MARQFQSWRNPEALVQPERKRRKSKTFSATSTHETKGSQDLEAVREWREMMSRTIDLEGIANDGFGYTVTISGPIGGPKTNGMRLPWGRRSSPAETDPRTSTMMKRTEVTVEKSWPSDRRAQNQPEHNRVSPESLDEMTFESMGLQMNGLLDDRPSQSPMNTTRHFQPFRSNNLPPRFSYYPDNFRYDESESDAQALPTASLPSGRTSRPTSGPSPDIREISWFGEPPRLK
jgi:hypothetical protein